MALELVPKPNPRPQTEPLNLIRPQKPGLSPDHANIRAVKHDYALGPDSPGFDPVYRQIIEGNEQVLQEYAYHNEELKFQQAKMDLAQQVLQNNPDNPQTYDTIMAMTQAQFSDVEARSTILESVYTKRQMDEMIAADETGAVAEGFISNERVNNIILNNIQRRATVNTIVQNKRDEIQSRVGDMPWVSWSGQDKLSNTLEQFIPFSSTINEMMNDLPGAPETAWLRGSILREKIDHLYSLPPAEAKAGLDAMIEAMYARNPYDAAQFLEYAVSYPTSAQSDENMFALFDIAGLVPEAKIAGWAKGAARAMTSRTPNSRIAAALTGNNHQFATQTLVQNLKAIRDQEIPNINQLMDSVPSWANVQSIFNGTNLALNDYQKLLDVATFQAEEITSALLEIPTLLRQTEKVQEASVNATKGEINRLFPSISHRVIDVGSDFENIGAAGQVFVFYGQRGDGTLFKNRGLAQAFIKKHIAERTDDVEIVQRGGGFAVRVAKAVDETNPDLAKVFVKHNAFPQFGQIGAYISKLRSARSVLPEQLNQNRLLATTTRNAWERVYDTLFEPLRGMNKTEIDELEEIMIINRDAVTPNGRGMYFETVNDFETGFRSHFKKLPSVDQIQAYTSYVMANDLDLVMRDLNVYMAKNRKGLENIQVTLGKGDYAFEGKVVERLPTANDFKVAYIDANGNVKSANTTLPGQRQVIDDMLNNNPNLRIIQTAEPTKIAVTKKQGDVERTVHFVVTEKFKRNRIGVQNFERRPGGHRISLSPYYLKQGRFKGQYFAGDQSILNAYTLKEAQNMAANINRALVMRRTNDPNYQTFLEENTPFDLAEFEAAIKNGSILDDEDAPVLALKSGERTNNVYKYGGKYANHTSIEDDPYNLNNDIYGAFLGERDIHDLPIFREEKGTWKLIRNEDTKVRPIAAMQMASAQMINERTLGHVFRQSVQQWTDMFGPLLKMSAEEIRADPSKLLRADTVLYQNPHSAGAVTAEVARQRIRQLMNFRTPSMEAMDTLKHTLAHTVFKAFGPKGAEWADTRMLPFLDDPTRYFKNLAFHMSFFGNVKQLFLQAQTTAHTVGLSPRSSTRGIPGMMISRTLSLNSSPKILDRAGDFAEKFGWRKEDFIEAYQAMKRSGWDLVGGETSLRDDINEYSFMRTSFGNVVNAGSGFFREGERISREAAWFTAYDEWRLANPQKKLGKRDIAWVLNRTSDLTVNMTRDANAGWQRGIVSIPTQFMSYNIRLAEQMLSKKTTWQQRASLIGVYSIMYGVPTAIATPLAFFPLAEMLKKEFYDAGIEIDDTALEAIQDGLVSVGMEFINFGAEDNEDDVNFSETFGPTGLPTIRDILRGDENGDLLRVLGGVSGRAMGGLFMAAASPIVDLFSQKPGGVKEIAVEGLMDTLREFHLGNNIYTTFYALNAQKWISRNGLELADDVTIPEAIFAATTGLKDQRISDAFIKSDTIKGWREAEQAALDDAEGYLRKVAEAEPGSKQQQEYWEKARQMYILSGATEADFVRRIRGVILSSPLVDNMERNYEQKLKERTRRQDLEERQ
jgi:hypothetical protein